jgi:galactokinase
MTELIRQKFDDRFNQKPIIVQAPGRINLIGEHTDYNNGFVMPAAIDKVVTLAIARMSESQTCTIVAHDFNEELTFSLDVLEPSTNWSTYIKGVVHGFLQLGFHPTGFQALFSSSIPVGAGLSSSAALCSAFAFAINEVFEFKLDRLALAKIAQQAEHSFAGVKCGIMDQFASLFGKKDSVILLDCQSLQYSYAPLALTDHLLLLIDTKVKHTLASSAYNKRRESCEEGVAILQQEHTHLKSLRDVSKELLTSYKSRLSEETYLRCHFVVDEIARTQQAAMLLRENKLEQFGALMYATHEGLSKYYEVSCIEADFLVNEAKLFKLTGARMMGGGFGGCTLNLIQKEKLIDFRRYIGERYDKEFGLAPNFYEVSIENGTHKLN